MNLLWDLDGTLIDSMPIIGDCFNKTLAEYGLPTKPIAEMRPLIGPELGSILSMLLSVESAEEIDAAKAVYRRFYKQEMSNSPVFDGIESALQHFQSIGFTQYVATAKYQAYGDEIVRALGLRTYFTDVYGSLEDGRLGDKVELLKHIITEENLQAARTIMIGDTHYDMAAARANNLTVVAVAWGYGNIAELKDAGAHFVVDTPQGLLEVIKQASDCGC